jgi:hypothetical protein
MIIASWNEETEKWCSACRTVKSKAEFYPKKDRYGKYRYLKSECKKCCTARSKKAGWMQENRERAVEYSRNYQVNNPGKIAATVAARKAEKLKRTPLWVDEEAIEKIYVEARKRSRETGVPHEVDHVIPLQGDLVSGLHVQGNLQIITAKLNQHKHNFFTP